MIFFSLIDVNKETKKIISMLINIEEKENIFIDLPRDELFE